MSPEARGARWWPLAAALLVRLACLPLGEAIAPSGDSNGYIAMAERFARTGEFLENPSGVRPPLFRVILAPGFDRSTEPWRAFPGLYLIQIAMDLAALALLMRLTRRRFGDRAAAAAGWLYALYPPAVLFASGVIMAESIAVLASAAALLALDRLDRDLDGHASFPAARVVVLGVVLGLGILGKELLVPVTGVICLSLLLRRDVAWRRRAAAALGAGALALAVTVPWLLHTARHHGVPVLSGTYSDLAVSIDNPPPGETSLHLLKRLHVLDGPERRDLAREIFRRALFEYPALTAERALIRARIAAGPEDMLPAWIGMTFDGYRPDAASNFAMSRGVWALPPGTWGRRVQLVCGLGTVVLFALGAAGLALAGRGTLVRTTLIVTLVVVATLALTVASARYRQMLVPFYVPFAGLALARLLFRDAGTETRQHGARRAAVCGLVVAVLLTVTIFLLPAP